MSPLLLICLSSFNFRLQPRKDKSDIHPNHPDDSEQIGYVVLSQGPQNNSQPTIFKCHAAAARTSGLSALVFMDHAINQALASWIRTTCHPCMLWVFAVALVCRGSIGRTRGSDSLVSPKTRFDCSITANFVGRGVGHASLVWGATSQRRKKKVKVKVDFPSADDRRTVQKTTEELEAEVCEL